MRLRDVLYMDYKYCTADFIHSQTTNASLFCRHSCSFVPRKVGTVRLGFRFWNLLLFNIIAPAWRLQGEWWGETGNKENSKYSQHTM